MINRYMKKILLEEAPQEEAPQEEVQDPETKRQRFFEDLDKIFGEFWFPYKAHEGEQISYPNKIPQKKHLHPPQKCVKTSILI